MLEIDVQEINTLSPLAKYPENTHWKDIVAHIYVIFYFIWGALNVYMD